MASLIGDVVKKVCSDCGEPKSRDDFPNHGPRGKKPYCNVCAGIRNKRSKKDAQARYNQRYRDRLNQARKDRDLAKKQDYDALKIKLEGDPKDSRPYVKRNTDWSVVVGDIFGGGGIVKQRDGIMMFCRPDGYARYAVMWDDSGFMTVKHEKAVAHRDRLWKKWGIK